jgi:hypothetical protein
VILQLRAYKKMGEKAIAQVYDSGLTKVLYSDANSIAILVKHMSGNMRSRWTMFLTTDGESPTATGIPSSSYQKNRPGKS